MCKYLATKIRNCTDSTVQNYIDGFLYFSVLPAVCIMMHNTYIRIKVLLFKFPTPNDSKTLV